MTSDAEQAGAPLVDPEYMRVLWQNVGRCAGLCEGPRERRLEWYDAVRRAGRLLEHTLIGRSYEQHGSFGGGLFADGLEVIALALYSWRRPDLQDVDDRVVVHEVLHVLDGCGPDERWQDGKVEQRLAEGLVRHGHRLDDVDDPLVALFQRLVGKPQWDPSWDMDLPGFLAPWTGTDLGLAISRLGQVLPAFFGPDPRVLPS